MGIKHKNNILYQVFCTGPLGVSPLTVWCTPYEAHLDMKKWEDDLSYRGLTFQVLPVIKQQRAIVEFKHNVK